MVRVYDRENRRYEFANGKTWKSTDEGNLIVRGRSVDEIIAEFGRGAWDHVELVNA